MTLENVIAKKSSDLLSLHDINLVISDLVRRHVLLEKDGHYEFALGLFKLWLSDVGLNSLMPDALSEDLAASVQAQEDKARVRSEEVSSLIKHWSPYRGRNIGTDEVRAWLNQVDSNRDQRLLFNLLENMKIFTDVEVRSRMKNIQSMINRDLPEFVIRNKHDRRNNLILTYIDGNGKSGHYYASLYAEENRILPGNIAAPNDIGDLIEEKNQQGQQIDAVIIVDDIAATGRSLRDNLASFLEANVDLFCGSSKIFLYIITVVATVEADKLIREKIKRVKGIDADFRTCEIIDGKYCAFSRGSSTIWDSKDEESRAKSLCMDLGARISKSSPLGYGDLGLLIVFPDTCPNNTLPILHSTGRMIDDKRWEPLFPRHGN